jgi:antitoxin component of RelBE/YafQ-DinJ toxin-antitoxin module
MPRAKEQKAISFNVSREVAEQWKAVAEANGMDLSSLIRSATIARVRELTKEIPLLKAANA